MQSTLPGAELRVTIRRKGELLERVPIPMSAEEMAVLQYQAKRKHKPSPIEVTRPDQGPPR